jgi:hypothetical protein
MYVSGIMHSSARSTCIGQCKSLPVFRIPSSVSLIVDDGRAIGMGIRSVVMARSLRVCALRVRFSLRKKVEDYVYRA